MIQENKLIYNMDNVRDKKPITAEVYLTNYCNNKCGYCFYTRNVTPEQKKYMTFNSFVLYVYRLLSLGVKGIILTGGGEPTINPDFGKITDWLEKMGVPYGVNTNFNVLKNIRPVFLKVSLDGYDRESYRLARGVDMYDRVIDNIRQYAEWKRKNDVSTNVGVQALIEKAGEAERFYNSVKSLDVQYINLRPLEIPSTGKVRNADDIIDEIVNLGAVDNRISCSYKTEPSTSRASSVKFAGQPSNFVLR